MDELPGLEGVSMGRGAWERDSLLCFRVWAVGDENMAVRICEEDAADAAMSVSESICGLELARPSGWLK
jgi:hypothetical protein